MQEHAQPSTKDVMALLESNLTSEYLELRGLAQRAKDYEMASRGAIIMGLKVKMLDFTIKPNTPATKKRVGGRKKTPDAKLREEIEHKIPLILTDRGETGYGTLTSLFYGRRRPLVREVLNKMVSKGSLSERKGSMGVSHYSLNGASDATETPSKTPAAAR